MNIINQTISDHPTITVAVIVHAAHTVWNFWKSVGGFMGLKVFFLTGSKPASTEAQPKV